MKGRGQMFAPPQVPTLSAWIDVYIYVTSLRLLFCLLDTLQLSEWVAFTGERSNRETTANGRYLCLNALVP